MASCEAVGDMCGGHVINDPYCHSSPELIYTPVNIPGVGVDLDDFHMPYLGCECQDCNPSNGCPCISRFGLNYDSGKLMDNNKPVMECNGQCTCSRNCPNRVVQWGPRPDLVIYNVGERKGFGICCTKQIQKQSFVCEYAGEVIGYTEAQRRIKSQKPGTKNYIIAVNEHSGGSTVTTYVDPTIIGNIGRYLNHSCEPNLFMVPVRIDTATPKLCLFAAVDIPAGTELCFDYSGNSAVESSNQLGNLPRTKCLCESSKCRGYLPFDDRLFIHL